MDGEVEKSDAYILNRAMVKLDDKRMEEWIGQETKIRYMGQYENELLL